MSFKSIFHHCVALAAGFALCVAPGMVNAAAAPKPAPAATSSKPPAVGSSKKGSSSAVRHLPGNTHLHSFNTTKSKLGGVTRPNLGTPAPKHSKSKHYRAVKLTSHISGVVHDAKGYPVHGATVRLAKGNGKKIRNRHARHTTVSTSAGSYSMRGVKGGRYRVVASKTGSGRGHKGLVIKTASGYHVDLKIAAGKPKKHKKG